MTFCCNSPSTAEIIEWRSGTKILICESVLCVLARRTIGKRAPRKLPRVSSLLARMPVKIVDFM